MKRLILILGLLLPSWVEAQSNFGSIAYTIPAGWNVVFTNDTFLVLAPDQLEPVEHLLVGLLLPASAQQSFASALDDTWTEVLSGLSADPVMDAGMRYRALPSIQTTDGRTLFKGEGTCSDPDGTYQLHVYLLQENDVYLRVFALANVLPASIAYPPTSALHNPRFQHQIPEFVLQLSTGEPLTLPPGPGQSLSGLWRGLSMFGGDIKNGYAYFYPDGRVYFASSMPLDGFDALPVDADAIITPAEWGRYSFDGGQGQMQFPYSSNEVYPFTRAVDQLTIVTTGTPHEFAPQASVDNLAFEGTYALHLLTGENPTLSLSSSGRFTDQGVLKYVDHWIYPFRVSDQPGEGTYAITNLTIVFRYVDGRVLRLPFSGLGVETGNPSPATLFLGANDDALALITVPAPRLRIVTDPANPGHLKISWPGAVTGFVLQATDSLSAPAWAAVPEQSVVEGSDTVVSVEVQAGSRFFRLVKP